MSRAYDDPTKRYVWPDGTVTEDSNGTGTHSGPNGFLFSQEVDPGGGAPTPGADPQPIRALDRIFHDFSPNGTPIIVDESAAGRIRAQTVPLQLRGYNAAQVYQICGTGRVKDSVILALARRIGGYVVTYDKPNPDDPSDGFAERAILLGENAPRTVDYIASQIDAVIGPQQ